MRTSPLRDTNRAIISEGWRRAFERRARSRVINPIRLTDEILGEIEEMNLRRTRRVPNEWQPRLALLAASLPLSVHLNPGELRAGISPARLIEALFEIQDQLLDLKVGPLRLQLRQVDAQEEAEEAARKTWRRRRRWARCRG